MISVALPSKRSQTIFPPITYFAEELLTARFLTRLIESHFFIFLPAKAIEQTLGGLEFFYEPKGFSYPTDPSYFSRIIFRTYHAPFE